MGQKKGKKSRFIKSKISNGDNKDVIGCEHLSGGVLMKKLMSEISKIERVCENCPSCQILATDATSLETMHNSESDIVNEWAESSIKKLEKEDVATEPQKEVPNIWMCLLCCRRGCSRTEQGHALGHFERQSSHCIALSLKNFYCWCYKCDEEVCITAGHPLVDYILALKKRFDPSYVESSLKSEEVSHSDDVSSDTGDLQEKCQKKKSKDSQKQNNLSSKKISSNVKGLANIGNTCFFNSTLQCLFHSSHVEGDLDNFLRSTSYNMPLSTDNGIAVVSMGPADKCNISNAIRDLFVEMNLSPNPLIYPNVLFNQICAKVPRFRGYQQQDAHELLRHMLDTIKNEEIQRVKNAIAEKISINSGKSSTEDSATLVKRISDVISNSTLMDKHFGGQIVDTIVCLECHSINTVLQQFLDISLPLKRPNSFNGSEDQKDNANNTGKRNKLRLEKKKKRVKEDKDGDWENNDDEDEEVQRVLALSMESGIASQSTLGRPDSGLGSGSSGGDPADTSGLDGLPPNATPTECEELTDEHLLASIAALQISNRESFPSTHKMSNKELRKRLQTLSNRPPPSNFEKSVYSALYWFTEREELKRENRYACEQCQKSHGNKNYLTDGSKQTLIARPPRILTLHLKRFEQVESRRSTVLQKITEHIDFPAILDISPFLSREAVSRYWKENKLITSSDALPDSVTYSLRGVVEHSGSLNGGHYVAYVRPGRGRSSSIDDEWYYVSDGSVRSVSLDNVLRAQAYILFYELDEIKV